MPDEDTSLDRFEKSVDRGGRRFASVDLGSRNSVDFVGFRRRLDRRSHDARPRAYFGATGVAEHHRDLDDRVLLRR